ncbi:MAG TPA: hypothetical protein VN823_10945 [Stellaceae bacterium]|nr:hypothetical protein [Stellaceae bacterium]
MARFIIVTAADANYGELAAQLIASIRAMPEGKDVAIGLIDAGLDAQQRDRFREVGVDVIEAGWDYDFSGHAVPPKRYLLALTTRPHLPRYFPGYDVYLHIDADAWLQDWTAIELYVSAAEERGFSIAPEVDRSYSMIHGNTSDNEVKYLTYRQYFVEETARRLTVLPQLNGGVFAGRVSAPHWKTWHDLMVRVYASLAQNPALDPQTLFYAEQACLNGALWHMPEPPAFLPAWCNWLCHRALPRCSEDGSILFEPNPPYRKLGIVHLTGGAKNQQFELRDARNGRHVRWLHYLGSEGSRPRPVVLPMRLASVEFRS